MNILKKLLSIFGYIILSLFAVLVIIYLWHYSSNAATKSDIKIPGDKIEIYDNEYIHSVKMGEGNYTIVFLPGMGTASPYYDYFNLASEVSKKYKVIIMEPFGYGFSDNTSKERTLINYENELSKVLSFYNINDNIILLGHSYSGVSNLNYANIHSEVKGIVCLDCTTAYQIETHVKNGAFIELPPKTSKISSVVSPIGLSRLVYSVFMSKMVKEDLLIDVPKKYHENYKYFLYNKTMNETIINEMDTIYYNQLENLYKKYRDNLYVLTILSDETIKNMKEYKSNGDFNQDWEEMHNLLISNSSIQKIYVLNGNHYIHHENTVEISNKIDEMINNIKLKK